MATKDIRPETVQVTEAAAWAQIQNLQKTVFERFGLPGVVQLNDCLRHNYNALTAEGEKHGQSAHLARGIAAAIFLTDLLPEIEEKIAHAATNLPTASSCQDLLPLGSQLLKGFAG